MPADPVRGMSSAPAAAPPFERHRPLASSNTVFKSGPLFISSKGIGWKSWKKRWFILTRTSLVFFKNDPSALPQRGGEVNLTLGGIDLNNSGSVVVREDKKLLTVLFPDGRDGRAFTLKAESSEDLFEWKTALEHALAQAPNAALVMGHNGIFRNDNADALEGSIHHWRDKRPIKSLVVGRPILLALEDIDGRPSFLEKALRFLEKYGSNIEGILRQSADVEEVDRRVQQYEQGKTEFSADEDAHVVGDCIKHVLRELPSSPVPASCCTALLEAYRFDRKEARVNAMRLAISETFPEPNRRLLQRVLKMMHTIASHTAENRMTPSAVAACMAPLLLRPLLAGECELEDDFDLNGDSSAQLLAAANAANNAQVIITSLIEEYDTIFDDDSLQRCSLSPDLQVEDSGGDESTDDGNVDALDNGYHDVENDLDQDMDDDADRLLSGKLSESSGYDGGDLYDYKAFVGDGLDAESRMDTQASTTKMELRASDTPFKKHGILNSNPKISADHCDPTPLMGEMLPSLDSGSPFQPNIAEHFVERNPAKANGSHVHTKHTNSWGRNNVRKNQTIEPVDSSGEEELAIQRLEITKNDLRTRIAKEAKGNAILQASLERRKQALHERRLALEQDVARLQEQLQAERDLRAALEVGLSMSSAQFSSSRSMDSKTRAELEEIALAEADVAKLKQKVAELHLQLNQQRQHYYGSLSDACNHYSHLPTHLSQQKILQQDFDMSLAFCNHEKKQRSEACLVKCVGFHQCKPRKGQKIVIGSQEREYQCSKVNELIEDARVRTSQRLYIRFRFTAQNKFINEMFGSLQLCDKESSSAADWKGIKPQILPFASCKQISRKNSFDTASLGELKVIEASRSVASETAAVASNVPSVTDGMDYQRHPSVASSTLVELTTRLDFFKERRTQLMEQLHSLDLSHGTNSQGSMYKPSPPWNSPR